MAERKKAAPKAAAKKTEPADVASRDGESRPVVTVNAAGSWFCPFDGHAQSGDVTVCPVCGAERSRA